MLVALLMVHSAMLLVQVRAADVELPEGATFVVANSLTVSKKAETADRRYALAGAVQDTCYPVCRPVPGSWQASQPQNLATRWFLLTCQRLC